MIFICFTRLVPSTSDVTKNNRQNCTSMLRKCFQVSIVVRVARSPKTSENLMFTELHIRDGVARNLEL